MKIGEAFQFTISTKDIHASQKFWGMLGFEQIDGDSNPFSWRILADPSLTIMVNEDGRNKMMPTWYEPDVDEKVHQLLKAGAKLAQSYDLDNLPSLVEFIDPDGFPFLLVEREGSDLHHPAGPSLADLAEEDWQNPLAYPNPQVGIFGEYSIPVKDMDKSIAFWETFGFELKLHHQEPMNWAILRDGFVTIGLYVTQDFTRPALTFFATDMESKVGLLRDRGIEDLGTFKGKTDKNQTLVSPEQQQVFLFSMGA